MLKIGLNTEKLTTQYQSNRSTGQLTYQPLAFGMRTNCSQTTRGLSDSYRSVDGIDLSFEASLHQLTCKRSLLDQVVKLLFQVNCQFNVSTDTSIPS